MACLRRARCRDGEPATDAEVEHVVLTGKGIMPSFANQITQEQLDAPRSRSLHTGLGDEKRQPGE